MCLGNYDLGLKGVLATYALSNFGMGYVWIIRIYFIVAMLIPLYKSLSNRFSEIQILVFSLMLFVLYEILCHAGMFENNKWNDAVTIISLLIFLVYGFYLFRENGHLVQTQNYKYPFQLYYLSYSVLVSGLLIKLTKSIRIKGFLYDKVILFISTHSFWIYLWHILPVTLLNLFSLVWYLKYIIVLIIAVLFTMCQNAIVEKLQGKVNPEILNIFRG